MKRKTSLRRLGRFRRPPRPSDPKPPRPFTRFRYPGDLVTGIRRGWRGRPGYTGADPDAPFPDDAALLKFLETIYHTSFLTEEGRRLTLHITYVTPRFLSKKTNYIAIQESIPLQLASPRPFTNKELLRIAPAIDPWSASLLVCDRRDIEPAARSELVLWGILNLRSDWHRAIAGEHGASDGRPGVLTVTSSRPGHIVVNAGWQPFAILANGEVSTGWNVALRLVDLLRVFRTPIAELDVKVAHCFGLARLPRSNMCDHWSEHHYINAIQRLLFLAAEQGHGACFLLVPETDVAKATASGKLDLKYPLLLPSLAEPLLSSVVASVDRMAKSHYGELSDLFEVIPQMPPEILANPIVSRPRQESVDEAMEDCWRLIAHLSQVDGAVLLTTALECLGFGCEIRVGDQAPIMLKHATGPACRHVRRVSYEGYGTRHRSAFRFCNAFPGAFALIVSQDGGAKLCTRIGQDVVFWVVSPSGLFLE